MNFSEDMKQVLSYAITLLSAREMTVSALSRKIIQKYKNLHTNDVNDILSVLKEKKYVDDVRFSECYITDRINTSPRGRRMLKRELFLKGISDNISEEALLQFFPKEKEEESLLNAYKKKILSMSPDIDQKKKKEKIFRFLTSRGFDSCSIYEVLKKIS